MTDALPIGVLHLEVKHGCVQENRDALTSYALEAARAGAKIIVAPELAVSGYSFESRRAIAACAETLTGETFERLVPVAKQYGAYICAGIVEQDPLTQIFYNSAFVVAPNGELTAHHRKAVSAERRWACPGGTCRSNTFDTPWGRVGVLICADSYFGLLPRSLALHGVDLLLVLANWPTSGVDPRLVWRARALENGFGVVGCNRTGKDRIMDCRTCRSYVVTSSGEVLLDDASEFSNIWRVDYPLQTGRLESASREAMMSRRRPEDFADLYLDVNGLEDFAGLWGLPAGGSLELQAVAAQSHERAFVALESATHSCDSNPVLVVLPQDLEPFDRAQISRFVEGLKLAVIAPMAVRDSNSPVYSLVSASHVVGLPQTENAVVADFGPARIALVRPESLIHPEVAVALSKKGSDVLVSSPNRLEPDDRLLLGVKCLERAAVAVASRDGALICEPPIGHLPWKQHLTTGPGICSARIDTTTIRSKRFHDRVDMEVLLRR